MQAVILAAGSGQRLNPITAALPKALIEVDGKPLLEYSLIALAKSGIKEVILTVGFLGEVIQARFGSQYKNLRLEYVVNEQYGHTGSMYSLSKARNLIKEDILLIESDLLYEPDALDTVLKSRLGNCVLTAQLSGSGDEVYICVDPDQRITHLGKDIADEYKQKAVGELVGISKYSEVFLARLFKRAEEEYERGTIDRHYEECVHQVNREGDPVYALTHPGLLWIEVDNETDLVRAREQIYPKIKKFVG